MGHRPVVSRICGDANFFISSAYERNFEPSPDEIFAMKNASDVRGPIADKRGR
jgi:hypothetical protein